LRWLELEWDEGPEAGGNFGPYFQSEREEIYRSYLDRLRAADRVYDDAGSVRFRFVREKVVVDDVICGHIEFDLTSAETNPDMTIRRPDGSWIFHFVNVVDDIEMKITDVIRGEDHLSNTPKHVQLYRALGAAPPRFAHIPLILNPDGSKMSKRDLGASVAYYVDQGYLPEAVRNYLCLLGWSPKNNREKMNIADVIRLFDIKKIIRSAATFDQHKLRWLSGEYMREMDPETYRVLAEQFLIGHFVPIRFFDRSYVRDAIDSSRGKIKIFAELPGYLEADFSYEHKLVPLSEIPGHLMFAPELDFQYDPTAVRKYFTEDGKKILVALRNVFVQLNPFSASNLEIALKETARRLNLKPGALVHPLRLAASGKVVGSGLYGMLERFGKERVIMLIDRAIRAISHRTTYLPRTVNHMENSDQQKSDKGSWWLPEQPDRQLHGTVSYGPSEGMQLELVGSLFPTERIPHFKTNFTVWGNTVRGKQISLIKAHLASVRTHAPGIPTSKVSTYEGVVGGFYQSLSEVAVHTVKVEFDYLAAWSARTGIAEQYNPDTRASSIVVQAPEPVSLGHTQGIEIVITPFVFQTHSREGITLRDAAQLELKSEGARPYTDFENVIRSFTRFLTLAVGEPASPSRIIGETNEKAHEIDGHVIWTEIEVIRQRARIPTKDLFAEEMLFTLEHLGPESGVTFQSFLEAEQRLKPVIDLLLLNYFHPELPIPQQFLSFVNAVEVLHRSTIGGQYLMDEQYRSGLATRLKNALPNDVPDEFRQSLETRLDNLNRFTLRKRLRDVLHKFEEELGPYVPGNAQFADVVVHSRNALLHLSDDSSPDYTTLWKVSQVLGLIVEIALLREIGFTFEKVRTIVGRGKRARMIEANVV
jgi:glutamyl/glutaminyl-tRNA synthetase